MSAFKVSALSSNYFGTPLLGCSGQQNLNAICEVNIQFPLWFKIVGYLVEDVQVQAGLTNHHTNSLIGFLTYAVNKSTVHCYT